MADANERIIDRIQLARDSKTTLRIIGQGSKVSLLGARRGDNLLDMTTYGGIERYRPEELVITVRAGTPLAEVSAALAEHGQCLAAEPPCQDGAGTIGGAVAAGLSGPARPFRGSLRDSVLGVEMVNGFGERLRFGGEVFKNVAGFDVARLLAGSEGALGVLLSVSLRVAPQDRCVHGFRREMPAGEAVRCMRSWLLRPLPVSGLAWVDGVLHGRLAGAATVVDEARHTLHREVGGDEDDLSFWQALRDRALPCFAESVRSWERVPPATPPGDADVCIDWAGGLRWRRSTTVEAGNGCVVGESPLRIPPVDPLLVRIKAAFDPGRIFNPDLLNADTTA